MRLARNSLAQRGANFYDLAKSWRACARVFKAIISGQRRRRHLLCSFVRLSTVMDRDERHERAAAAAAAAVAVVVQSALSVIAESARASLLACGACGARVRGAAGQASTARARCGGGGSGGGGDSGGERVRITTALTPKVFASIAAAANDRQRSSTHDDERVVVRRLQPVAARARAQPSPPCALVCSLAESILLGIGVTFDRRANGGDATCCNAIFMVQC